MRWYSSAPMPEWPMKASLSSVDTSHLSIPMEARWRSSSMDSLMNASIEISPVCSNLQGEA